MTLSFAPERIETWPLERLKPYARNAKTHGADQVAKIAGSMAQFGWTVPVLCRGDGEVIAGHGRILAADAARADRGAGDRARPPDRGAAPRLPHRRQQADRARRLGRGAARRRAAGAARPRTSTCRWSASPTPNSTSCSPSTSGAGRRGRAGVPPVPSRAAAQPGLAPAISGSSAIIGCSAATAPADDVRRLMNGERAVLFATDPPYLVDYDGSNHPTRNKDWSPSYGVTWDDSSQGAELYDGFIAAAVAEAITEDAAWYCWHASRRQAMLEACWEKGRRLRAPADHLGEGPRGSHPVALPLEARALLHGLASPEPAAEGGGRDAGLHLGDPEPQWPGAPGGSRRAALSASPVETVG